MRFVLILLEAPIFLEGFLAAAFLADFHRGALFGGLFLIYLETFFL